MPFATWLSTYRREWLSGDLVGGLTVAAVVIPKTMAYALIAGFNVEAGLYSLLAAMLVYPLLGTSRLLIASPTLTLATMTAAGVIGAMPQAGGAEPIVVGVTLTLLVGVVLAAASVLRLGFLANFISLPVLIGFQAGVGIVIVVSQLKSLLGVSIESKSALGTLLALPAALPEAHVLTALVGTVTLVTLVVLERFFPRRPISLLLVGASIALSILVGLEAMGVKTVGAFPPGLPALRLPDVSLVAVLLPAALGIALMAFTESTSSARASWQYGEPRVDANRELLAFGAVNAAAAFIGALPSSSSVSHAAVARRAGGHTQLAQWTAAAVVVATLLLLQRVVSALPEAALAAVVLVAAVGMVKAGEFRAIARVRSRELAWALASVLGVVLLGTLQGILIAVAISVLTLMYEASNPLVYAVAYNRKERVFRRAGENGEDETFTGLLMLRPEGRLMFANVASAGDKMRALVEKANPRVVVLECSGVSDVEYTALVTLVHAEQRLREQGVELWLAGVNPEVLPVLARSPLAAASDPSRLHANLDKALEAWQRGVPPRTVAEKAEVRS